MQITIPFCAILFLTYIVHVCLADDDETKRLSENFLKNYEDYWKNANVTIEKRGYMSNRQIQNKFRKQYNLIVAVSGRIAVLETQGGGTDVSALVSRIETAEADITSLQTNQATISDSLLVKCQKLDELLDPDTHCCKTGFAVLCVGQFLATTVYPFSDLTKGACPECPTELVASG